MATKKLIMHVCDRCGHEQKEPLSGQLKVMVSAKKWTNWDLCTNCHQGLGDFLVAGVNESHDNDGDI